MSFVGAEHKLLHVAAVQAGMSVWHIAGVPG